jgi:neutral ceramidase
MRENARVLRAAIVLAIACAVCAGTKAAELRAGRAAVRITPAAGVPMGSSYGLTISTGVHDDLYTKALALESGEARVAIVACDLISLRRALVVELRREVERVTGLSADRVMLHATHTHCGPQMHSLFLNLIGGEAARMGEKYRTELPGKVAEAVRLALADLQPARAWWGIGREEHVSFNRRFLMKDGGVVMNPNPRSPDLVRAVSGIDPAVPVLYFDSPDGKPLATWVNFAMHPAIAGGPTFSADYPGRLAAVLAKIKGPEMLTLFTMGTAGDVNHLDVTAKDQERGQRQVERVGEILAADVIRTYSTLRPVRDTTLRFRRTRLRLPPREYNAAELEEARRNFPRYGARNGPPFLDVVKAWRVMESAELAGAPLEADVQAMSLGDEVAWVGLPGEIFVDLGKALKNASPFAFTIVSGMSASGTISYVPTRVAFPQGSYEVTSSRVAPGGGEALIEAAAALLYDMYRARGPR